MTALFDRESHRGGGWVIHENRSLGIVKMERGYETGGDRVSVQIGAINDRGLVLVLVISGFAIDNRRLGPLEVRELVI